VHALDLTVVVQYMFLLIAGNTA